jgi:lysophospholipase L1-like esterase
MNRKSRTVLAAISVIIIAASGILTFSLESIEVAGKPTRVACVGDSITEGSTYPYRLKGMLGPDYRVGNFGVSGSTVSLNSKTPYMNQSKFREALEFRPDIVVIMLGTNDANAENSSEGSFEAAYSQLVNSFQQLEGKQLIWIVKSPPIFTDNPDYNDTYLASTILLSIDKLADEMNLPTVDMYSAFGNHSDYFMDGVHPDSKGAALIASKVYDAITLPDGSPDESYFSDQYLG